MVRESARSEASSSLIVSSSCGSSEGRRACSAVRARSARGGTGASRTACAPRPAVVDSAARDRQARMQLREKTSGFLRWRTIAGDGSAALRIPRRRGRRAVKPPAAALPPQSKPTQQRSETTTTIRSTRDIGYYIEGRADACAVMQRLLPQAWHQAAGVGAALRTGALSARAWLQ